MTIKWKRPEQFLSFLSFQIRSVTPLGVNADWPGWCFDDENELGFTGFEDESADWFEQTLNAVELRTTPRHSEADYSEV